MARHQRLKLATKSKPSKSNGIGVDFHNDPKPRFIRQPRVILTLNPDTSEICMEVAEGAIRRLIPVTQFETIRNNLQHQLMAAHDHTAITIGMNAEPTIAQIKHWEDHSRRSTRAKLSSNCPFCIAEAKNPERVQVRTYDTRGNRIRIVTDPSDLGF